MNLAIITPCSRPENLRRMCENINNIGSDAQGSVKIFWYIVHDAENPAKCDIGCYTNTMAIKGGVSGNLQRNLALDRLIRSRKLSFWVYFLDDDNIMHPNFVPELRKAVETYPSAKGFIFSQELPAGGIRISEHDSVKVCHIDQAQYCLHTDLIGNNRFVQQYEADGIFIEKIYKENPGEIVILPQVMSYYNFLRR